MPHETSQTMEPTSDQQTPVRDRQDSPELRGGAGLSHPSSFRLHPSALILALRQYPQLIQRRMQLSRIVVDSKRAGPRQLVLAVTTAH